MDLLYSSRSESYSLWVLGFGVLVVTVVVAVLFARGRLADSDPSSGPVSVRAASGIVQPVNAVLGDASFAARFGRFPRTEDPESLRIGTHLAFVERLLRSRPADHLTEPQQQRRSRVLDLLRSYRKAGVFPQNHAHPERRTPVFIDRVGRICAVGYLIARTAGRSVAERINREHKFAAIQEIDLPLLQKWATRHGFTERELAMIQPQYDYRRDPDPIQKSAERVLLGLTTGTAAVNGLLAVRSTRSWLSGGAGIALGATSLAVVLSDRANWDTADLTVGTAALLASGWNLVMPSIEARIGSNESRLTPALRPAILTNLRGRTQVGAQLSWDL